MSKQTLRELAKEYAKGNINKESYRKSRSDLIQNIISGNAAVKQIDFVEPLKPPTNLDEAITEGINRDRDTTQITSPDQRPIKPASAAPSPRKQKPQAQNKNKSPYVFIIASIIIVALLIVAVVLFYPKPPESTISKSLENSSTNIPSSNNGTTTNNTAAADSLIGNFLNEKNWSQETLNNFIASWNKLSQVEKDASVSSKRMQRLQTAIYKQFLDGKALESIDREKAIARQQMLVEFANAIGINDTRLVIE